MPVTTTYSASQIGGTVSISSAAGVQQGGAVISLGNGSSAIFYYDVAAGVIAMRTISDDGLTLGPRLIASSGSVSLPTTLYASAVIFGFAGSTYQPVSAAKLANGNIVLTWQSNDTERQIFYRIFDSGLNAVTGAVNIGSGGQLGGRPDVAALAGGGFAIAYEIGTPGNGVWEDYPADIMVKAFSSGGNLVFEKLNITAGYEAHEPSIVGLADGGLAVSYSVLLSEFLAGNGTPLYVFTDVLNSDGTYRYLEASVGTYFNGGTEAVALSNGGFTVAYPMLIANSEDEITTRTFNSLGQSQYTIQATNQPTSDNFDVAGAVSSEGLVALVDSWAFNATNTLISARFLAPDGSALVGESMLAGGRSTGIAWTGPGSFRIVYDRIGGGDDAGADTDASLDSRAFEIIRSSFGDGADDTINYASSTVRNAMFGSLGNDSLTGGSGNDLLNGEDGNDILVGGNGADTLNGADGADNLHGDAGNDVLDGGAGINTLDGGTGNDRLVFIAAGSGSHINGGADVDTLAISGAVSLGSLAAIEAVEFFGPGGANLTLTGTQFATGLAAGTVLSGVGTLTVNMTAGVAFLPGGMSAAAGSNVAFAINGTAGTDIIKANLNFRNTIDGGDSNDQIRGGGLVDTINGGIGNDKILAFTGADILTGGAGADQFRYLFAGDSGIGANADRITDFLSGTDRLNFALLDADPVAAGRQALTYIDTAAFTATGAAQVRYGVSGADLLVQVDLDGNGTADMEIVLQGASTQTLTSGDFML